MTALATDTKTVHTAEEVWQLSLEDKHFELINGELIPMAPTKLRHGRAAGRIASYIGHHVLTNKLGEIYIAEAGYQLPSGDVLAPDVSFISKSRLPKDTDAPGFEQIAPDLVVEIYSDSNTRIEMQQKADLFFAAGTRQMWVVYPNSRTVYFYTAPDKVVILRGDALIEGGDVLPGFTLRVADIFSTLDE